MKLLMTACHVNERESTATTANNDRFTERNG